MIEDQLQAAGQMASQGDFLNAVRTAQNVARDFPGEGSGASQDFLGSITPGSWSWCNATLRGGGSRGSGACRDCLEVLQALPQPEPQLIERASRCAARATREPVSLVGDDRHRSVTLLGAYINIARWNHSEWDNDRSPHSRAEIEALTQEGVALAQSTQSESRVAAFLLSTRVATYSKPDAFGVLTLLDRGMFPTAKTVQLADRPDTFVPRWRTSLPDVDVTRDGIRIALTDRDGGVINDEIAELTLKPDELRRIAQSGEPRWIDVSRDSNGQVLLIGIEVR